MALVRWNRPSSPWASFFDEDNWPSLVNWPDVSSPAGLDIYETDEDVVVEAQIPGVKEQDVNVSIEGNVLTITAKHEETEEEKNKKRTVYKTSRQSSFSYSTSLPRMVDATKAEADVENGVVTVKIPKSEEEKPRKIEVKKKSS
jgi:HSP20 family protein